MRKAEWWFCNRAMISCDPKETAEAGDLKILTRDSLRERLLGMRRFAEWTSLALGTAHDCPSVRNIAFGPGENLSSAWPAIAAPLPEYDAGIKPALRSKLALV
jgi:hypothetical protein